MHTMRYCCNNSMRLGRHVQHGSIVICLLLLVLSCVADKDIHFQYTLNMDAFQNYSVMVVRALAFLCCRPGHHLVQGTPVVSDIIEGCGRDNHACTCVAAFTPGRTTVRWCGVQTSLCTADLHKGDDEGRWDPGHLHRLEVCVPVSSQVQGAGRQHGPSAHTGLRLPVEVDALLCGHPRNVCARLPVPRPLHKPL